MNSATARTPSYWGNVGLPALFTDDLDGRKEAFDQQLRLCRTRPEALAPQALGGLAAIATRQGDPKRAARLLGAATATRRTPTPT